ncbi:glycerol-3-phosphate dehydrogenase/oxidase [Adhaeretor mobilis]|uniref:Glycerol-3-phosphate dehydrogenase n=1 Tax=Adhaeretor mobilis TaxID=1930276 RepID=A0A517N1D9_9BACT|nr:glycerol-3-phosphate dehydrogenase/oxidase [Adhaeretor mobilis]QDT00828.1 Aerobic glycerol-3-phosphate dehydrogenase [Adhaeretor mobilis]
MKSNNPTNIDSDRPLDSEVIDLLVVGGGIVGAGVARDGALRGLKTKLIDQNDFASGTSSKSSRLLHGGIRYLAQMKIGLVREASREKTVINRIAPHLSDPLAFVFPTRRKSPWSYWKLSLGVKLYDWLCGGKNLGKSRSLNVASTLKLLPNLDQQNLTGSVRYYDGLTNDARLVLDTLRSAAASGAEIANYTRFVDASYENDLWTCQIQEQHSDGTSSSGEIRARCVVNATGPWSHRLPNSETSLRLTKGVHLVIDKTKLPVPDAVVVAEGERILFAIPWGERVILGTTDTDYDGPIGAPTCTTEDQQYVLDAINRAFPVANLVAADVISTWAGLRPLVADKRGNPSDISRRHEVAMSHPGWWDVTGGKLTTYRLMGEETIDQILQHLELGKKECATASTPLLEEKLVAAHSGNLSGILPPEVSAEAVRHYCQEEWAQHLDDVMIRRTSWRYYHREHLKIAEQVAQWMGEALHWGSDRIQQELNYYRAATTNSTSGQIIPRPHFAELVSQATQRTHVAVKP